MVITGEEEIEYAKSIIFYNIDKIPSDYMTRKLGISIEEWKKLRKSVTDCYKYIEKNIGFRQFMQDTLDIYTSRYFIELNDFIYEDELADDLYVYKSK